MKKRNKALLTVLGAVLLMAATAFGTMAYLTDKDTVVNTFTVGHVKIELDEAKVNEQGKPIDEENQEVTNLSEAVRVVRNTYHLLPGHSYTKDPTVTIKKDSEESYIRMMVKVSFGTDISSQLGTDLKDIFTGYNARWVRTGYTPAADGMSITYEYRYEPEAGKEKVAKVTADTKLPALFTGITVPTDLTNEELAVFAAMTIEVTAHAIQADGFDNAQAAWAAFAGQNTAP